jgi:hypothetical protein
MPESRSVAVAQALMMQKIILCAKIDERTLDNVNKLNRSEARALPLCCAKPKRGYLRPVAMTRLPMGASVPRDFPSPPLFVIPRCLLCAAGCRVRNDDRVLRTPLDGGGMPPYEKDQATTNRFVL